MNTEIRFLQQFETDLTEAAAREAAALPGAASGSGSGYAKGRPRRVPLRERHWGGIAAALVAFVVLAGSIGFLSQHSSQDSSAASAGFTDSGDAVGGVPTDRGATQPKPGTFEQASPAPAPGLDEGGSRAGALTSGGITYDAFDTASGGSGQAALHGASSLPPAQAQGDLSKIVRDGRISVIVPDGKFETSLASVSRVATSLGGFVLTSSTRDQNTGTFTLRIPAKKFDVAMERLRGIGEVQADEVTGEDVTAEFIDQTARLKILLGQRDLLRSLQAKATSSSEILRFAGLIDQTQFEIEKSQGQLRFIKNQVAEATIKVELREQHAPEESPAPTTDNPSLGDAIRLGWEGFLRVVSAVIIGLGYLVPVAAIGLAIWAIVTLVRRRRHAAS